MKKIIILILLLSPMAFVPVETLTWPIFLVTALETFLLWCFGYQRKTILFYFFAVSLLFNWGFNTYIDEFYQYATPYLEPFNLKYKLDYFACVSVFKFVAIFFEIILLALMTRFTESLCLLVLFINILSAFLRWGITRWMG